LDCCDEMGTGERGAKAAGLNEASRRSECGLDLQQPASRSPQVLRVTASDRTAVYRPSPGKKG